MALTQQPSSTSHHQQRGGVGSSPAAASRSPSPRGVSPIAEHGGVYEAHVALRKRLKETREARSRYEVDDRGGLRMPDIKAFDNASQFVRERLKFMRSNDKMREAFERHCELQAETRRKERAEEWAERQRLLEDHWRSHEVSSRHSANRNRGSSQRATSSRAAETRLGLCSREATLLTSTVGDASAGRTHETSLAALPLAGASSDAAEGLRRIVSTSTDGGAQDRHKAASPPRLSTTAGGSRASSRHLVHTSSGGPPERRVERLREEYAAAQEKRRELDSRMARADHLRHLHLTTVPLQREWLKIAVLQRSLTIMRHLGDAKFYRMKQLCRLAVAACCAGRWWQLTRRTRRRAAYLKANIIFKYHLPRLIERYRAKKFGRRIDVIKRFLQDLKKVFQIPHSIKRFCLLVRQSQIFVRKHLLARKMWAYAILASWEKCIERDVALFESAARYAVTAQSNAEHMKKLRKIVRTLENRQLLNGSDTPLLMFIPYEFRAKIVGEFLKRWTHETVKRMVAEEARQRANTVAAGGTAAGGQGASARESAASRLSTFNAIRSRLRRHQEQQAQQQQQLGSGASVAGGSSQPAHNRSRSLVSIEAETPQTLQRAARASRVGGDPRSRTASDAGSPGSPTLSVARPGAVPRSPLRQSIRSPFAAALSSGRKESTFSSLEPPRQPLPQPQRANLGQQRQSVAFAPHPPPAAAGAPSASAAMLQQQRQQQESDLSAKTRRSLALASVLVQDIVYTKHDYAYRLFSSTDDIRRLMKFVNDNVFAAQRNKREEIVSQLLVAGEGGAPGGGAAAVGDQVGSGASLVVSDTMDVSQSFAEASVADDGVLEALVTVAPLDASSTAPPPSSGVDTDGADEADDSLSASGGDDDAATHRQGRGGQLKSGVSGSGGGRHRSVVVVTVSEPSPLVSIEPDKPDAPSDAAELDAIMKSLLQARQPTALNDMKSGSAHRNHHSEAKRLHNTIKALLITGMIALPPRASVDTAASASRPALLKSSTSMGLRHKMALSANIVAHLQRYSDVLARAGAESGLTTNYAEFYGLSNRYGNERQMPLLMELPRSPMFIQQFVVEMLSVKDNRRYGGGAGALGGRGAGTGGAINDFTFSLN